MTASSYDAALARLLVHEGGYTNDKADPGGPTNFGITIEDARKYAAEFGWIKDRKVTADDVRAMPLSFAKEVYRAKYWDAERCDDLPAGVDYAVFDYGVNSGIGRSGNVLRRCLDLADTSSAVSDTVIAAAKAADADTLISAVCDERLRFLKSLHTWGVFGKGWSRRVAEVKAFALHLADQAQAASAVAPAIPPMIPESSTSASAALGKGQVTRPAMAQIGSAAVVAIAGTVIAQQTDQSGHSAAVVALVFILAGAVTIGVWYFWHWWHERQQQRPV